ncbi:hypothetical protein, partial [Kingella kingae]|uniref:hypothetical protein n=1 Tax=Kingella kingae TaxID=504 RepID=UPI001F17635A
YTLLTTNRQIISSTFLQLFCNSLFFHNFYFSTSWKLEFGKLNTAQVERLNAMLSLNHVNENNNVQAAFLHEAACTFYCATIYDKVR